jgi:hypothetical protein
MHALVTTGAYHLSLTTPGDPRPLICIQGRDFSLQRASAIISFSVIAAAEINSLFTGDHKSARSG